MRFLIPIAALSLLAVSVTQASTPSPQQKPLSPSDQAFFAQLSARARTCQSNSHKCQAACEAANQLQSAADDLSRCAQSHDYSDDCSSKFSDVRDASDEYESAVQEAAGDCE